jgi:hypothetical protein
MVVGVGAIDGVAQQDDQLGVRRHLLHPLAAERMKQIGGRRFADEGDR